MDYCKQSLEKIFLDRNFALEKYARSAIVQKAQIQSLWKTSLNLRKIAVCAKIYCQSNRKDNLELSQRSVSLGNSQNTHNRTWLILYKVLSFDKMYIHIIRYQRCCDKKGGLFLNFWVLGISSKYPFSSL